MKKIDVSVVVTAHREGLLLRPAFASIDKCIENARQAGITIEVIVSLDRSDALTSDLVERYVQLNPDARVILPDAGDPGKSRNVASEAALGKYVAFLDGDDLWGRNWLSAAFNRAETDTRELVLHPEVNVYFGHTSHAFLHIDMEHPRFNVAGLAVTNYWTSLCFVRRDFLIGNPYPISNHGEQIGYEDWSWNLAVIERGAIHKVVPGTGHAIRMKRKGSVNVQANAAGCMPLPAGIFVESLRNTPERNLSKLRIVCAS